MKQEVKESETELYKQACYWRERAERYCSPGEYRIAADFFDRAGYTLAADRCRERADFYSRSK